MNYGKEVNWWDDESIEKMWVVAQAIDGMSMGGQIGGWMPEGLFKTQEEAIKACEEIGNVAFCVSPLPIGILCGTGTPDGLFFPLQQTKEEGLAIVQDYRVSQRSERAKRQEAYETDLEAINLELDE